jgi:uncharacterized membrane protein YbhN (UPF0104 family)
MAGNPDTPPSPSGAPRTTRGAGVALRALVGVAVVALLLWRANPETVFHAMARARFIPLAAAFALTLLVLVVSAFRWRSFLEPLGHRLSPGPLVRLCFVGAFFNAFLPTGVGGDAYKATRLRGGTGALTRAFASVLLDRAAGIVGLALLALAAAAVLVGEGLRTPAITTSVALAAAGVAGSSLLVTVGHVRRKRDDAGSLAAAIPAAPGGRLRLLLTSLVDTGLKLRAAALGLVFGVATAALIVGAHVLVALSLRISVSVWALTLSAFLSVVVVVVPFTINGLGIREATYVWSLTAFGVAHDQALAFAFLILGILLASSAVGGVVYLVAGGEVDRSGKPELGEDRIHQSHDGDGVGRADGRLPAGQHGVDEPMDQHVVPPEQIVGDVAGPGGSEPEGVSD